MPAPVDLRPYVEAELGRVLMKRPGWRVREGLWPTRQTRDPASTVPSWILDRPPGVGTYSIEVDERAEEFLVWFGQYQAGGVPHVTWIMNPAVHVPFEAFWPAVKVPVEWRFGLADVLEWMLSVEERDQPDPVVRMRYPPDYVSLT